MELQVRVEPEALHFVRYPFWPASVRKRPAIASERFTGWNPGTFPPSLIADAKEVLFIPASSRDEVNAWALTLGIRTVMGPDNWSLLLEPFLDTEFTPQQARRTESILGEQGFSPGEVAAWRSRVSRPISVANSFWWEWIHLGHYDALTAVQRFSLSFSFQRFYWDSMEAALRGFAGPSCPGQPTA